MGSGLGRSAGASTSGDRARLVGDHQALEMSSPNPVGSQAGSQPASRGGMTFLGLLSEKRSV